MSSTSFTQLRDTLGAIYTDEEFADLFSTHGQPALAPWRLALVTVFQFMENLTDRQAADAVRDRLAWKYALSLELADAGFDHTVLVPRFAHAWPSARRNSVYWICSCSGAERVDGCAARGRQRTDSTHILARDPLAQSHVMRGSDHGLCLECADLW